MAVKFYSLLLALCSPFVFKAQVSGIKSINALEVPKSASFKGRFVKAFSWNDTQGKNVVVFSESDISKKYYKDSDIEERSKEIYAAHYLITGESATQTWKMLDFEKNCPFDLQAAFKEDALQITDLDKNGIAEVWCLYRTACRSDVSPLNMKIIMYEGKQKYAMRGQTKVQISEHDYFGGNYTMDPAFQKASRTFQDFGAALWKKFVMPD
jgi:hypothetical protein